MKFVRGNWYRVSSKEVIKRLLEEDIPSGLKFFSDGKWHQCTGIDLFSIDGFASFEDSKHPDKLWNFNSYPFLKLESSRDPATLEIERTSENDQEKIPHRKYPVDHIHTEKNVVCPISPDYSKLRTTMRKTLRFGLYEEFDRMVYQKGMDYVVKSHSKEYPSESLDNSIDPKGEFPSSEEAKNESIRNETILTKKFLFGYLLPKINKAIGESKTILELSDEYLPEKVEKFLIEKGYEVNKIDGHIEIKW